jgi:hypothetical protein
VRLEITSKGSKIEVYFRNPANGRRHRVVGMMKEAVGSTLLEEDRVNKTFSFTFVFQNSLALFEEDEESSQMGSVVDAFLSLLAPSSSLSLVSNGLASPQGSSRFVWNATNPDDCRWARTTDFTDGAAFGSCLLYRLTVSTAEVRHAHLA